MRTKQFNIRLSQSEIQAFTERAKAAGKSASEFARLKMGLSDSKRLLEKRLIDIGLPFNLRQFILSVSDETAIRIMIDSDETAFSQIVEQLKTTYRRIDHASIHRAGNTGLLQNTGI